MGKFVVLLISLGITLMWSSIGALPCLLWGLSLKNYLAWFAILTFLQLAVASLWNYKVNSESRTEAEKIKATKELANSIQYLDICCSYCGTNNLVRILLGQQNTFDCDACKQTNSVIIEITPSRVTKPIMPKAEAAEIFKNIDTTGVTKNG